MMEDVEIQQIKDKEIKACCRYIYNEECKKYLADGKDLTKLNV